MSSSLRRIKRMRMQQRMARRVAKILLICVVLCFCAAHPAWATEHHGQVFFHGAPVPGAVVTLSQGDKRLVAVTDRQGLYEFPDLADGEWKIHVEMTGF